MSDVTADCDRQRDRQTYKDSLCGVEEAADGSGSLDDVGELKQSVEVRLTTHPLTERLTKLTSKLFTNTTSTQPRIPPGSLNRVPALHDCNWPRDRGGKSPLPGGR